MLRESEGRMLAWTTTISMTCTMQAWHTIISSATFDIAFCHEPAGLMPLLENNSTSLTVFAPSNDAWAHLPPGLVLNDSRALGNVILYHIALGAPAWLCLWMI